MNHQKNKDIANKETKGTGCNYKNTSKQSRKEVKGTKGLRKK